MDRRDGRPLWPTLIVLVGTIAAVVLVLLGVADRGADDVTDAPGGVAATSDATASPP